MAIDHFIKHKWARTRTDWNFNILFNEQPQVAELARQYAPLIKHPGLYEQVPGQWLHATILRVGFLEDFTEAEMLAVAEKLESILASINMPQLILGRKWWLWNGGPALSITPDRQLREIFRCLLDSLTSVVGRDRLPTLSIVPVNIGRDRIPARLQFMPHVTLAYPKTYKDERSLSKQLKARKIDGVAIRATRLSLIKQRVEEDYYVWEIVKEMPIGQLNQ